eukprot:CAMPEP_0114432080 /NCGR_PEP_ID=MMETSP0103-20121206/10958_1 /TAXON_ID=37642 ORGANISM="Paraphysomonas imperforata, Strain PA2" /NCGR_SAMPLE_ID=MMETSP0103 /ASSEMBLY_ACC=CAM_ASM_000201 /LENGTH=117 /DNA_ID=CAMNT_0001601719 /DNA_START=52 /DNA_END=406 /DNA_ORIENTATION=+
MPRGTNSQGNTYNTPGGTNSNQGSSYHYSNSNGSYYYANDNGSTYYNSGSSGSDQALLSTLLPPVAAAEGHLPEDRRRDICGRVVWMRNQLKGSSLPAILLTHHRSQPNKSHIPSGH